MRSRITTFRFTTDLKSMKRCTLCKTDQSLDMFNKNKSRKDGLNNVCKTCSSSRSKQYYAENRSHHKQIVLQKKKDTIAENRIKLLIYLETHHCVDCGFDKAPALQFDHVRGTKTMAISRMLGRGLCWETILNEIDKCEVRCANCHSIKTAEDLGYYSRLSLLGV